MQLMRRVGFFVTHELGATTNENSTDVKQAHGILEVVADNRTAVRCSAVADCRRLPLMMAVTRVEHTNRPRASMRPQLHGVHVFRTPIVTWKPWHHHTLFPFRLTAWRMLSPTMAATCGNREARHPRDLSSPNVPKSMNAANGLSAELPPGCLSRGPLRLVLHSQHFRSDAALAHRPPSLILAKKTPMRALVVVEFQTHPILDFIILSVRTRGTHHVRETCTFARSRVLHISSFQYTKSPLVREEVLGEQGFTIHGWRKAWTSSVM